VQGIEDELFAVYADPAVDKKPEMLSKRGGAHYSTAAFGVMQAVWNGTGARLILCCRNNGAVPGFDDEAVLEVPARVGRESVEALPQHAPPPAIRGLMQCVKDYESLTVDAALTGDRDAALQALLLHPLLPGISGCAAILDDLLAINEPHLRGTFFPAAAGAGHGF
jgi:6-phospho-beta-glucosidase